MAVTVLSVSPQNNDNGVYRDPIIRIEFSEELANTYLTSEFFKVYIQPGWTGTVQLSITKDLTNPKIVKLVPLMTLAANQAYAIWVMGDKNLADATITGVQSILGNGMSNHTISYFTTGSLTSTEAAAPAEIGGYNPVPSSSTTTLTPADIQALANANSWLDVLKTKPADGDINISGLSSIIVYFDKPIMTYGNIDEIVTITAEDFVFGVDPAIPTILDVTTVSNRLIITTDDYISTNTQYTVTILAEGVSGLPINGTQEGLPVDYSFSFNTVICPSCSTPSLVRFRGGALIPNNVPNNIISRYILEASMWAIETTGAPMVSGSCCPDGLSDLVTCKVIYDIATGIGAGTLLGIKEKQLADLRIVYDAKGISDQIKGVQDCIEQQLSLFGISSIPIAVGIKSKNAAIRPYVGGKRIIHGYDSQRFSRYLNAPTRRTF